MTTNKKEQCTKACDKEKYNYDEHLTSKWKTNEKSQMKLTCRLTQCTWKVL